MALPLADGAGRWRVRAGVSFQGPVVRATNAIVVGGEDGFLRSFDPKAGGEQWRFQAGAPVRDEVSLIANQLSFSATDGNVFCVR